MHIIFCFQGRTYTLTLTCPTDSALFILYFIYRTDIDVADEFDTAPKTSPYSTLTNTFRLAEKEGWDAARISWLLTFNVLKTSERTKLLFGAVDEQVFCFIKNEQRHSTTITCTNLDCTDKERNYSTTELTLS